LRVTSIILAERAEIVNAEHMERALLSASVRAG
jgi:hypothetical protein